jgi:hypothetical protein
MDDSSMSGTLPDANYAATLGALLYESGVFPGVSTAAQAFVKILAGMEVGVGPIRAMSSLDVINGKVVMDAPLMASLILHSDRHTYHVEQHNETRCKIDFFRDGTLLGTSDFTIEDAREAGLIKSLQRPTLARDMLFARAISNGARSFCPEVLGGSVYTPEELDAVTDDDDGEDDDGEDDDGEDDDIIDAEFEVVCNAKSQDPAAL